MQENCTLKPTLFIALGGTGMEIARRLRQRILAHVWRSVDSEVRLNSLDEFPFANFIYFDLVDEDRIAGPGTAVDAARFCNAEKLVFNFDLGKYFRSDEEIARYPHIAEWVPFTPKSLATWGVFSFRLPAVRAFSRLYVFDEYSALRRQIEDKIGSLLAGVSNRSRTERYGLEVEPASLRVVVIASTAGCTGSGSFLDIGYLAKWLAGRSLQDVKTDLFLMLPTGYGDSGHGKSRSETNTYAALMELETCMGHGNRFVHGWREDEYPELPQTPYDDILLFDTENLAEKVATPLDLFDMVANVLFEDFLCTEFCTRKNVMRAVKKVLYKVDSFCLPVDGSKYGSMKMMYSKAYSSFGQSTIDTKLVQQLDENASKQANVDLIATLERMLPSKRTALFRSCLETAMPWVDANLEGVWSVDPYQYFCVIGVSGAELFEKKFGDEFKAAVPARARMSPQEVRVHETGIPGKLTCYVELSGFPLTALGKLPNWRNSYDVERARARWVPVHIHKDRTLFVHPLAPSAGTLDCLAEDFKLFVQAIVFAVLKPYRNVSGSLDYCITVSDEKMSIGNERSIRMEGIASEYLVYLQKKVADALDRIKTIAQYAGLVALYDYYTTCVYPPAIIKDENLMEYFAKGFCNIMCANLGEEARKAMKKKSMVGSIDTAELIAGLKGTDDDDKWDNAEALNRWTDEIDGSYTDVYENEVGKSHMSKRILKRDFFQEGWLENCFKVKKPDEDALPSPDVPLPPRGFIPYKVAIDGKSCGPFDWRRLNELALKGQLTSSTKVWRSPMKTWQVAGEIEELLLLLSNDEPPPDDEPPPIE